MHESTVEEDDDDDDAAAVLTIDNFAKERRLRRRCVCHKFTLSRHLMIIMIEIYLCVGRSVNRFSDAAHGTTDTCTPPCATTLTKVLRSACGLCAALHQRLMIDN